MKRIGFLSSIIFSIILINSTNVNSQSIGKVFDKDLANVVFGKVYFSFPISEDVINKIMDDTTNIVMFKVTPEGFGIFNKNRSTIYPDTANVGNEEPCYLFSKDKIKELVDRSKDPSNVTLEMRGSHITLTSDEYTLEMTILCPPICP